MYPEKEPVPLALRPREAAKALGISERTLWQLAKEGKIAQVRVGNGKRQAILYPMVVLQEWLRQNAIPSNQSEAA